MKALLLATLLFVTAMSSVAETDFTKIRKDINVMSKIFQGAFEEGDCNCSASVRGSYLAKQGAVFLITPSHTFVYRTGRTTGWEGKWFDGYEFESLSDLAALPDFIGDVLADVHILDLSDFPSGSTRIIIDRESRKIRREVGRERRKIENQIRELEIQSIHADEDEQADIDDEMADLNSELAEIAEQQDELDQKYEEIRQKRAEKRDQARDQVRVAQEKRIKAYESVILESLCDYGGTLKSVPRDEHVTVVIEHTSRSWTSRESKIYVFSKNDLQACQTDEFDSDDLISKAIVYNF